MFESKTGELRSRVYRANYQGIDTVCGACGEEKETAEPLILYCKGLHLAVVKGETALVGALGCKGSDGKIGAAKAEITKQRLSDL